MTDGASVELVGASSGIQQALASQEGEAVADDEPAALEADAPDLALPGSVAYAGTDYVLSSIAPYAFYLSGVTSVVLPASVTDVDERAFRSSDVSSVDVAEGNEAFASFDGALYDADLTSLLLIPGGRTGAVRVPDTATSVPASAFSHCAGVGSIAVDEGSPAFSSWEGSLYDADGTTLLRVPAGATDITIRDGCTTIAAGAMEGCAQLASITAPASVASISPDVFANVPTVSLPAASAVADSTADAVEGLDGSASEAPGPANVQLSALVALSSAEDDLPSADPAAVAVSLPAGADAAPWRAAGFSVEGEKTQGDSAEEKSLPMASVQEADVYGAALSTMTFDLQGGSASYTKYAHYNGGSGPGPATETGSNLTTTKYHEVCGFATAGDAEVGGVTNNLLIQLTTSNWNGEILEVSLPTKQGYAFAGWKRTKGGILELGPQPGDYHLSGDVTLTAQWTRNAISTVNLYLNAGNTTTKYKTIYLWYGKGWYSTSSPTDTSTALTTIGTPSWAGRTYKGFSTSSTATVGSYWTSVTTFPSNTSSTFGSATTAKTVNLYAVWKKNAISTVNLYLNAGNTTTKYKTIYLWYGKGWYSTSSPTDSSTALTTIGTPSWDGRTYKGFSTSSTATVGSYWTSVTTFPSNTSSTFGSATTAKTVNLYAVWEKNTVYAITLNMQSGTGGTPTIYQWTGKGFYLTPSPTDASKVIDEPISVPSRVGYTFGGYYTGVNGAGTRHIDASGNITAKNNAFEKATTLYAFWTKPYWGTLDVNKGHAVRIKDYGTGQTKEVAVGSSGLYTVQYETYMSAFLNHLLSQKGYVNYDFFPVRTGYTAVGWKISCPGGAEINVNSSNATDGTQDVIITNYPGFVAVAQWRANTYKVSFNPNGGSGGQASQVEATYDSNMPAISAAAPKRDGYTFLGWYDNPDYTKGNQYYTAAGASARKYDKASACTLYAGWSKSSTMSLDANGGTFTIKVAYGNENADGSLKPGQVVAANQAAWNVDFTVAAAYPDTLHYWRNNYLHGIDVIRPGYTMQGWTGTVTVNSATGVRPIDNGYALKVAWSANPYTIAFDTHCDLEVASVPATYDANVTLPEPPLRPGYIFQGWDTEADGTGTRYTAGPHVRPNLAQSGTVTLHAQWVPAISADVPQTVEATVDLLGIEDQVPASGYIESRSAAALKVAEVSFGAQAGATELFGADAGQVLLQALPGEEASWATDVPAFSFALDASGEMAIERDPVALAPFAMDGYERRIPISYRFAIPPELLEAIDPARFEQVVTPVCSVAYTVALVGPSS